MSHQFPAHVRGFEPVSNATAEQEIAEVGEHLGELRRRGDELGSSTTDTELKDKIDAAGTRGEDHLAALRNVADTPDNDADKAPAEQTRNAWHAALAELVGAGPEGAATDGIEPRNQPRSARGGHQKRATDRERTRTELDGRQPS